MAGRQTSLTRLTGRNWRARMLELAEHVKRAKQAGVAELVDAQCSERCEL